MADRHNKHTSTPTDITFYDGDICLNHETLNHALKLAGIGFWEWDLTTDMIHFGDEATRMLGLDPKVHLLPMAELTEIVLHEGSKANFIENLEKARSHTQLQVHTYKVNHIGGTRWVQVRGVFYEDQSQKPKTIKGIIKDVTNEITKEKRLSEDLNFIKAVLDTIPHPMFYKDNEGKYKYFNKAFLGYLGKTYEELYNKTVYDIAPDHLAKIYDEADHALMTSKGEQKYETEVIYADGSTRLVEFIKVTHLSLSGEVKGLLGLMEDITKRKEEETRTQLMDLMKETILVLNNQIIHYKNQDDFFADVLIRFQDLFGKSQQSSILEIGKDGLVRSIVSQGYDKEEIDNFEIRIEETFIYRKNNGWLDNACIINDLVNYQHNFVQPSHAKEADEFIQSCLEIPIVIEDTVKYIISIDSLKNHVFDDSDLFVANYLRTQFQVLYRVFDLYQKTLFMSRYDMMTGLMNRRYFDKRLHEVMTMAAKKGTRFYIVLYDLDGLKKINDTYGHHIGDAYIQTFSRYLKSNFSEDLLVGRIGGDEFVGIVHSLNHDEIIHKNELMRQEFMKEAFETPQGPVSGDFSYGIKQYHTSMTSIKELIKAADEEMYRYKER